MRYLAAILFSGFLAIFAPSCGGKKESEITWTLALHDTGSGVLMDITGASILFEGMTYEGTNRGELTIFDPHGYVHPSGIGSSVDGWGSPEKPGRPELAASYWSAQQKCEIEFGPHKLTIRNKGQTLDINGHSFQFDPITKPRFVVRTVEGKINVMKQQ